MLVNAVVGACITLLIFLVVRDAPIEKDQEKTGRINQNPISFWVSIKLSCRNYQNWLCGIYTGCLNLPIMVLGALWGNLYLTQGRGFSSLAASNIISLLFIGLIIGAPLMGCLSDKLKSRRLPMLLSALLILLTITIVIGTRPSHILFSLLFFFMGILSGAQVLSYPIISESNPRHLESTSLGLVAVIVNIGGAFSQTLFSWMMNSKLKEAIEHFHQAINSYEFALFILPLAFIISFISAFLIKEFRQKSPT
jgi:sugar phosphate permease